MVSASPASRPTLKAVASPRGLAWLQQDALAALAEKGTLMLAGAGANAGAGTGADAGTVLGGVAGEGIRDIIGSEELLRFLNCDVPSPRPASARQDWI